MFNKASFYLTIFIYLTIFFITNQKYEFLKDSPCMQMRYIWKIYFSGSFAAQQPKTQTNQKNKK